MMSPTWPLTQTLELCRSAAISALDRPEPTSVSTSRSLTVSSARSLRSGAPSVGGRCGRKRPIRRRVVEGATTESPLCTLRMAYSSSSGGADLSRNPLAPARSASKAYSSRSKVVRMRTRGRSAAWQISRVGDELAAADHDEVVRGVLHLRHQVAGDEDRPAFGG